MRLPHDPSKLIYPDGGIAARLTHVFVLRYTCLMPQLEHIEAIEKRLWNAADKLRANSNYASNEYFLPVMGLIFLRHAYSRYLAVKDRLKPTCPTRGGKTRELTKEDFSQRARSSSARSAVRLSGALTDGDDRARGDHRRDGDHRGRLRSLKGVLPKSEYQELDNDVLGQLLRTLQPGRAEEAHPETFRPHLRILPHSVRRPEGPRRRRVLHAGLARADDRQCASSRIMAMCSTRPAAPVACSCRARTFVEQLHANPHRRADVLRMEKNPTTIRLAKMNLAVHGLEGTSRKRSPTTKTRTSWWARPTS